MRLTFYKAAALHRSGVRVGGDHPNAVARRWIDEIKRYVAYRCRGLIKAD